MSACCFNCGKEGSNLRTCVTCKEATYCNDVCGCEHWEKHVKECNYATIPVHVDFVMAPEGYEMDEEHPEYIIDCPNPAGTELVEYKMSEIGRKFASNQEGQFFGSKEGIPPGGVDLDHSLDAIGDEYILQIGVKTLSGDLVDVVQVRGNLKRDIKVRKSQSRAGQEVVIMPDLKGMIREQSSRSPIRIENVDQPHILEFQMLQAKTIGTEEKRKEVFSTNGVLLPDKFFAKTNKYGGLRTAQGFASRKAGAYRDARRGGAGKRRSFLTALTTRVGRASKFYKGKMKGGDLDVKIAVILTKDDNSSTATLEEAYFKIHPSLFEKGDWYDPEPSLPSGPSPSISAKYVNVETLKAPVDKQIDAYDLEDITALCWHLEKHIDGVGELLKEEDDERYALFYKKHSAMARRYLNSLKPHQAALERGIGDDYDAPSQVNSAIRGAMEMESIDALFKSRAEREKKKWKKANKDASIGELRAMAEALLLVLDPPPPGDSKWEKVKGAAGKLYRKLKGQRGKAKGRLRGTVDLIRKKRTEAPADQQDEIQELLNRAAGAQV